MEGLFEMAKRIIRRLGNCAVTDDWKIGWLAYPYGRKHRAGLMTHDTTWSANPLTSDVPRSKKVGTLPHAMG